MTKVRTLGHSDSSMMKKAVMEVHGETISEEYAVQFLRNPTNLVTVAFDEENPVGIVIAHFLDIADGKARELFLYEIDVIESQRRKGVGSNLISETIAEAERAGAGNVFIITEASNTPARRLYISSGFTESGEPAVGYERVI